VVILHISETNLIVRYAETDQMGIVHHSNYPVWFEAGRTDFIKSAGMSYSEIEGLGILLPLIELKCNYKGAAKYEDEIKIKTSIKEITFTKVTFYYEVFKNQQSKPITTGETIHVWTDKNLKPVNLKKAAFHVYQLLNSLIE
jgi:acyl-CoA thioester hydrolase